MTTLDEVLGALDLDVETFWEEVAEFAYSLDDTTSSLEPDQISMEISCHVIDRISEEIQKFLERVLMAGDPLVDLNLDFYNDQFITADKNFMDVFIKSLKTLGVVD